MAERPITIRPRPLGRILASSLGRIRLRRPPDGLYKNVAAGDALWLREQFYLPRRFNSVAPSQAEQPGVAPTFGIDLGGDCPRELGLGVSRPAYTLPRFWSRYHFDVLGIERQRLQEITDPEARAEGFSSREYWLEEWDDMVTAVSGRSSKRLSKYNPTVLVFDLQLNRQPIESQRSAAA